MNSCHFTKMGNFSQLHWRSNGVAVELASLEKSNFKQLEAKGFLQDTAQCLAEDFNFLIQGFLKVHVEQHKQKLLYSSTDQLNSKTQPS